MTALKRIRMPLIFAVALLFLLPAASLAEPVGTFTRVEDGVDVLRVSASRPVPVRVGDPVSLGDAVRTKRNGKAEIRFRDETTIQLAPESRIVIDEYSFGMGESRERGLLSLFRGKIRAIVSKAKAVAAAAGRTDTGFNIKTPTAIAGVKGTDFIVYYQRGVSGVIFIEGFGFVYNPQQPDRVIFVQKGEASFVPDAASSPSDAQPVSSSFVDSIAKDTAVTEAATEGEGTDTAGEGGAVARGDATGQEGAPAQAEASVREVAPVTVSEANTTFVALTDQAVLDREFGRPQGLGGPSSVGVRTAEPPPAPTPQQQVVIPPTERQPELIKPRTTTPVTVNVTLP